MSFRAVVVFALSLCALNCIAIDPRRELSPHFRNGRYHNLAPDDDIVEKGFLTVLRWQLFGPWDDIVVPGLGEEGVSTIALKTDDFMLPPGGSARIIWMGHSTVWLALATREPGRSVHIITDPVFGDISVGPITSQPRLSELPLRPEALPRIDYVAVSHGHRDHLDLDSILLIQKANPEVVVLLPSGLRRWAEENGIRRPQTMEWWTIARRADVTLTFLPAQHWSRMGINDMMQSHWGSFAIENSERRIYFAGDSAYSEHYKIIRDRFGGSFDATLLPIGAFQPRWFMRAAHMNPPEALVAARDLNTGQMLPVHWGTFELADEKPTESAEYLRRLTAEDETAPPTTIWKPGSVIDL